MPKTSSYHDALLTSLADPEEASHYLNAVLQDNPQGFLKALRNVAQANQIKQISESSGANREGLRHALADDGNPDVGTLSAVLSDLGLRLAIATKEEAPDHEKPHVTPSHQEARTTG
jgi:probable addiction module antidote protein